VEKINLNEISKIIKEEVIKMENFKKDLEFQNKIFSNEDLKKIIKEEIVKWELENEDK